MPAISRPATPVAASTSSVRRRGMAGVMVVAAVAIVMPLIAHAGAVPTDDATTSTTAVGSILPDSAPSVPESSSTTIAATSSSTSEPAVTSTVADSTTTTTEAALPSPTSTSTSTTSTPPPAPPALDIAVLPEQIEQILATIRHLESRGDYTIPPNKGNASGAYQFIESTWNAYAGYQHAYLAPPHIQDERAALDVDRFLERWNGDVSMIPVMWYYPRAARELEWMDRVPRPDNGNVLTVREYQTRWLAVFATLSGEAITPRDDIVAGVDLRSGAAPEIATSPAGSGLAPSMSFPVLGPSRLAIPECDVPAPTSGPTGAGLCDSASAVVLGVKLQPVLAVVDGVVTDVDDEPSSGRPISVTLTDPAGRSYVHSGFNDDNPGTDDGAAPAHLRLTALAEVGTVVRAGQVIGFMGNSDPLAEAIGEPVPTDSSVVIDADAVAPHVRITVVDAAGRPVDAFGPVVESLFVQTCRVMIGQWSVPPNGEDHEPVVIETIDDDDSIDSEWIITSAGQVHAAGWAAMISPNEECAFAPADHHGPGAAGSAEWLPHWLSPLELSTPTWVAAALRDGDVSPVALVG